MLNNLRILKNFVPGTYGNYTLFKIAALYAIYNILVELDAKLGHQFVQMRKLCVACIVAHYHQNAKRRLTALKTSPNTLLC